VRDAGDRLRAESLLLRAKRFLGGTQDFENGALTFGLSGYSASWRISFSFPAWVVFSGEAGAFMKGGELDGPNAEF
jgi:hypothetical protein